MNSVYQQNYNEFKEYFNKLSSEYNDREVFSDLMKMCAIAIYNSFAKNQEFERKYLDTIKKYSKDAQQIFPKMFGNIIMMCQNNMELKDFLGEFYEKEKFCNAKTGQFFTPIHISDFMAKIVADKETTLKMIEKKGYVGMSDPCCGSGRMALSYAKAMLDLGINYQDCLLVHATDIVEVSCYITYIQLSLYGIPAIVFCGDTISMKMNFAMQTPFYFLQYYKFSNNNKSDCCNENNYETMENVDLDNQTKNILNEVTIKGNNQFCLW